MALSELFVVFAEEALVDLAADVVRDMHQRNEIQRSILVIPQ